MSFFNRLKNIILDITEDEFPKDYVDDGNEYHIIPEKYDFTYSSVRGDFRLDRIVNGFCASWKKFIVSRDWNGNVLYTIDGFGRAVAVSPDKTKIVTTNDYKEIAIFDAQNGNLIASASTNAYISELVWTKNNSIIGSNSDTLFVFDLDCNLIKSIEQINGSDFEFISGLCLHRKNEDYITVLESNGDRISILNFKTGETVKTKELRNSGELFYSEENQIFWIPFERKNYVLTLNEDLEEIKKHHYNGKAGVQYSGQEDEYSCTAWTTLPALSPNGKRFLVNDRSGLLNLISANSEELTYRTFNRNLIDYAYAMIWEDGNHFVALLDNYRVVKVNIRGTEPLFLKRDNQY
jgi:WD40 repeat protein